MAFAASVRHSGGRSGGNQRRAIQPRGAGACRRPYPILVVPAWLGVFAERWNGTELDRPINAQVSLALADSVLDGGELAVVAVKLADVLPPSPPAPPRLGRSGRSPS